MPTLQTSLANHEAIATSGPALFLLTILESLKVGQRKRRQWRFVVLATSAAAAIPTFKLTHEHWMTEGSDITVEPWHGQVVRLEA